MAGPSVALDLAVEAVGASFLRGAGEGEERLVELRVLSRSAGSLYEVGGLWGLRDWYR